MLTIYKLREFGANVDEAIVRCAGNEAFYLMLVKKSLGDPGFDKLEPAINEGDLDRAFEISHALKGVAANLSLTPLFTPLAKLTDLLRSRTKTDYSELLAEVAAKRKELSEM